MSTFRTQYNYTISDPCYSEPVSDLPSCVEPDMVTLSLRDLVKRFVSGNLTVSGFKPDYDFEPNDPVSFDRVDPFKTYTFDPLDAQLLAHSVKFDLMASQASDSDSLSSTESSFPVSSSSGDPGSSEDAS